MRALIGIVLVAACSNDAEPVRVEPPPAPVAIDARDSNVFAADYVGPERCAGCHPDEHARWQASLHRVMNATADEPGAVIGDFAAAAITYRGKHATFQRDARGYVMTLDGTPFRVTRTIGRRGLQEYVGTGADGVEVRLPFAWWPRLGGWYPQAYFDPWLGDEAAVDAFAAPREPWAARCPWCHSTYPFAQRIARSDARGVGHGLEQTVTFKGSLLDQRGSETLDVAQQITTGISCESCHLGGRAHAAGGAIHLTPHGAAPAAAPSTFATERRDAAIVSQTCAQCHSGPSPRLADGTALRNSSEALDLAASPCTTARCTDCHDPHAGESRHAAADTAARAIAACVRCHDKLADPATARVHAGDHAGVAGLTCLDCHMPRVVMGIDHVVRTHRISSPTDPRILGDAGPNACNLCHLDRSIRWTVRALGAGHDVHLAITRAWIAAYRDLDAPVGEVWLADTARPALRILAAAAYARAPALAGAELPAIARGLTDRLAYVRAWTFFAIADLAAATGKPAPHYDLVQPSVPAAERLLRDLQ